MKYLKFSKQFSLILGLSIVLFSSCKKVDNFEPIGDGGQKYIKIVDYGGIKGTSGYTNSALVLDLSLPTEVVPVVLELTTSHVYDQDITVTVGYSAAKLTAFNAAQPAGEIIFLPLSSTQYSLSTTTVKIKAGQTMSEPFNIIFRPDQLDIALSYLLPIEIKSITGGNGELIAAGTGTAYFHIIGNPLAGNYDMVGERWNYTGSVTWTGPPAAVPAGYAVPTTLYNAVIFASPIDDHNTVMDMGNVPNPGSTALAQYFIKSNATYSSITFTQGSAFDAGYSNIQRYIPTYVAPAPSVKAKFRLVTKYNNATGGTGSDRIVDQTFTHQ